MKCIRIYYERQDVLSVKAVVIFSVNVAKAGFMLLNYSSLLRLILITLYKMVSKILAEFFNRMCDNVLHITLYEEDLQRMDLITMQWHH